MKKTTETLLKTAAVMGLLYSFLVSVGLMGAAFKGFGKGFAHTLIETTSNPFVGLFIGIFATSIVQSSSTTTSITVGMVASNVLTIPNAVPIIMGANIGTTVTNTLVSLGHVGRRDEFRRAIAAATVHDFFNLICVAVLFPLELATGYLERAATFLAGAFQGMGGIKLVNPVKLATTPAVHLFGDFAKAILKAPLPSYILMLILSVVILFFSLYFIVKVMKSLLVARAEIVLDNVINKRPLIALFAGLAFTIFVQSSSITTSLLVPLVAAGVLTVEGAFPMTIGANIGTTSTAILASFATGNINAVTIALAHFLFNLTGTVCIYPIKFARAVPVNLAKAFGDLAAEKRRYAFVYVLGAFFVLPGLLILVSRCLK
jgi:sodium-dependent phosphate cotransporter